MVDLSFKAILPPENVGIATRIKILGCSQPEILIKLLWEAAILKTAAIFVASEMCDGPIAKNLS